jgi:hypothetical protein
LSVNRSARRRVRAFALARMRVRAGAPRAARAAFVIGGKGDIASRPIGFAHEADR